MRSTPFSFLLNAVFCLLTGFVHAQGILKITNGANLKATGTVALKLQDASLVVQGALEPANGTVTFSGTASGVGINATNEVAFNHLTINLPGQGIQLGQAIRVNGTLAMLNGTLDLNGHDLTLGQPNGSILSETETNRILGPAGGEIVVTANLNSPISANPGNIGVAITSSANLGATTIRRGHTSVNIPGGGSSVERYFDITPAQNTNLNATLRFNYFDAELAGLSETKLDLFRENGSQWESGATLSTGTFTRNTNFNFIQKAGLANFSRWTLAQCLPVGNSKSDSICSGTPYVFNGVPLTTSGIYRDTFQTFHGCDSIITLALTVHPKPNIDLGANNAICPGEMLSLDAGSFPGIQWSTGSTTSVLNVSSGGTYSVTVTDLNGCTSTDAIQITANPTVVAEAGINPPEITCLQLSVVLMGSVNPAGGSNPAYSWSTNNGVINGSPNQQTITVIAPGWYYLSVLNTVTGCIGIDSIEITASSDVPLVNAGPDKNLFCVPSVIQLSGSGSVGSYMWTGPGFVSGSNTLTPTVNLPGVFVLTVTNPLNGCANSDTMVVIANNTPPTATAGMPQVITCAQPTIQLNGSGSASGPGITYQWTGPGTIQNNTTLLPTVSVAGVYILTVSNATNGCTATSNVLVTSGNDLPMANAGPVQMLLCDPGTLTLQGAGSTGSNFTYQWSGPGTIVNNGTLNPVVAEAGIYTLTVTNTTNACSATSTVTVNPATIPAVSIPVPEPLSCQNTQINLDGTTAGNNLSYSWTSIGGAFATGSEQAQVTVTQPGYYYLAVKNDVSGCIGRDTVLLEGNTEAPALLTTAVKNACFETENGSLEVLDVVGGLPPFQYALNGTNIQGSPLFTGLQSGVYELTVVGANQCEKAEIFEIIELSEMGLSIFQDSTRRTDSSIVLLAIPENGQGPFSYQWSGNGLSCNDCDEPVRVSSLFSDLISCTITDASGCTATAERLLYETTTAPWVGIPPNNVIMPDGMGGNATLEFPDLADNPELYKENDIIIFNRWGQIVFSAKPYLNDWHGTDLNGSQLPEGTYYYILELRGGLKKSIVGNVLIIR